MKKRHSQHDYIYLQDKHSDHFLRYDCTAGRKSKLSKIKLLDRHLIDKIAAGNVVERPASVVRSFENAIDAGSTYLEIEIRNGESITYRYLTTVRESKRAI